jgi:hypothetical protein
MLACVGRTFDLLDVTAACANAVGVDHLRIHSASSDVVRLGIALNVTMVIVGGKWPDGLS